MRSPRERPTLTDKERKVKFTEPHRGKTSQRLSPSPPRKSARPSRLQTKANVFTHLNRCLLGHFFGSQYTKSQGGAAVCGASIGRPREQSLLLLAQCFHL
jgi:hypothetical protein